MVNVRRHQQIIIVIELIEDGVIFQTAIVIAEHSVRRPHGRKAAYWPCQQMVEKGPCVVSVDANLSKGRNIKNRAAVSDRMVFVFRIAIINGQKKFIPIDVVLIFD